VPTDRHEHCSVGMRHVPVHPKPEKHPWARADVGCDSCQDSRAATAGRFYSCEIAIARM
jgi:hypothetical protein